MFFLVLKSLGIFVKLKKELLTGCRIQSNALDFSAQCFSYFYSWTSYYNNFLDAGENGFGLSALPLRDCPENAVIMGVYVAAQDGRAIKMPNTFCIFERYAGDIMWRHTENQIPNKLVGDLL